MALHITFNPLKLEDLVSCAEEHKQKGYRCVQMLCTNTEEGIDLQYTFMKDDNLENYTIKGVKKGTVVPSITNLFLSVFVFENEAHDLFGVNIEGNLLDFGGRFYDLAENEPMTFISPEQKEAKIKAAKIAAAKAAKDEQFKKVKDAEQKESLAQKKESAPKKTPTKKTAPKRAATPKKTTASSQDDTSKTTKGKEGEVDE